MSIALSIIVAFFAGMIAHALIDYYAITHYCDVCHDEVDDDEFAICRDCLRGIGSP